MAETMVTCYVAEGESIVAHPADEKPRHALSAKKVCDAGTKLRLPKDVASALKDRGLVTFTAPIAPHDDSDKPGSSEED